MRADVFVLEGASQFGRLLAILSRERDLTKDDADSGKYPGDVDEVCISHERPISARGAWVVRRRGRV